MLTCPIGSDAELRPLEPWRAGEFAVHVERARPHLAPWLPWARSITDLEGARRFLQRYADQQAADQGRIYGIWTGADLAGGALFRVFDTQTGVCELGAWLAPEAEGRGLVHRAALQLIGWAIGVRGIRRVEWRTDPTNARSVAAARRLGMTREGVLRGAFPIGGLRRDLEIWSLLAEDWPPSGNGARAEAPQ